MSLRGQPVSAVAIVGTTTNDNAVPGNLGEYMSSTIAVGAAIPLTTATPADVTLINLTPGDWDVWGVVDYSIAGTTSITQLQAGISLVAATFSPQIGAPGISADPTSSFSTVAESVGALPLNQVTPVVRVSLAAGTKVRLITQANFTVSTVAAYGTIQARRVR